jgi:hypothetical protein
VRPDRRTTVTVLATGTSRNQRWPLSGGRVTIAGRKAITNAHGKTSLRLRVPSAGVLRARLVAPGLAPVTERLRVARD